MQKDREPTYLKQILTASQLGFTIVAATFDGLAIGYGLDTLFHTSPYLTVLFFIIGVIAGFVELFRAARKL